MARKCRLLTNDVNVSVACELSQPVGKTEFSSTAKNSTHSVSYVRKGAHGPQSSPELQFQIVITCFRARSATYFQFSFRFFKKGSC